MNDRLRMRKKSPIFGLFLLAVFSLLAMPVSGYAQGVRLRVDPASSQVRFTSKPPLRVVGKTNQIRGTVVGNLSSPSSLIAEFSVALDSLDTGINQRNKTMRDKCLETNKYPNVTFKLSKILRPVRPGEKTQVEIEGIFDLHGIKRTEKLLVNVLYDNASKKLNINAEFLIRLSDYQIKRPHILFFQLSDLIKINLDLALSPSSLIDPEKHLGK